MNYFENKYLRKFNSFRPNQKETIDKILKEFKDNKIILLKSPTGCVDKDTEYLTPNGWKKISEFNKDDLICAVDPVDDYKSYFEKPLNYIKIKTDEYGYRVYPDNRSKLSMFVSKEHKIYYETTRGKKYIREADDFFENLNNHYRIVSNFKIQNTKGIPLSEWELRLMVAICADGTLINNKNIKKIEINIKKEKKRKRLEYLLNKCNINYTIQKSAEGYKKYYFKPPIYTKKLSDFGYNATIEQLKIIADESTYWDGMINKDKNNISEFYTTIKEEADFMQYCYQNVYNTVVGLKTNNRIGQKIKQKKYNNKYTRKTKEYTVYVTKRKNKIIRKKNIKLEKFPDGYKYCFTTSTGFWLARKDDYIFITGNSGKSIIGVATALNFSNSFILTSTKQLQKQYKEDFNIHSVYGKTNYKCLRTGKKANSCVRQIHEQCKYYNNGKCKYNKDKELINYEDIVVMNMQLFLNLDIHYRKMTIPRLLIIDEAHLLESEIVRFLEFHLSPEDETTFGIKMKIENESDLLYNINIISQLINDKESFVYSDAEILTKIKAINTNLRLMKYSGMDNYIISEKEDKIKYTPIDISFYLNKILNKYDKILMMSATLNKNMMKYFNFSNAKYIEVPSTFKKENRQIHYYKLYDMSYNKINNNINNFIKTIESVANMHKNEKGIIHTISYDLSKQIWENSSKNLKNRLLYLSKNRKDEILDKFRKSKNKILISPSITTGVDFKYDDARFQIIAKVPFPYLGDERVKLLKEKNRMWYIYETVNTLEQMYGRTNRAEDDFSITYIFDKRFSRVIPYLSNYMKEAIVYK